LFGILAVQMAMTHAKLNQPEQAKEWLAKITVPRDAPWEEAARAAILRPEVQQAVAEAGKDGGKEKNRNLLRRATPR
jgi:hypothetical protein